eukprot:3130694-Prymnesium_polylepis.1
MTADGLKVGTLEKSSGKYSPGSTPPRKSAKYCRASMPDHSPWSAFRMTSPMPAEQSYAFWVQPACIAPSVYAAPATSPKPPSTSRIGTGVEAMR